MKNTQWSWCIMKNLRYLSWIAVLGWVLSSLLTVAKAQIPAHMADDADLFNRAIVIHFQYDPPFAPLPVLYLKIGNSKPLPFLIDLASPAPITLSYEGAKLVGLGTKIKHPTDNERKEGILVNLAHVSVLRETIPKSGLVSLRADDVQTVILPFEGLKQLSTNREGGEIIVGSIGSTFLFSEVTARFNFQEKTLKIVHQEHPPLEITNAVSLPLITVPNYYKEDFFVSLAVPNKTEQTKAKEFPFLLDTGSVVTTLTKPCAREMGALITPARVNMVNADTVEDTVQIVIPQIRIQNHVESTFSGDLATNDETLNVLGMNFLSRFEITLDPRHKRVYFKPLSHAIPPVEEAVETFACENGKVADLVIGSSPERVGLHEGDVILSIDDITVKGFGIPTVQSLLNSMQQRDAHLRVRRGDKEMTFLYRRYPLSSFGSPFDAGCGLEFELFHEKDAYTARITSVVTGSSAAKAGLRLRDQIVSIDGLAVATTPWEELAAKLCRPLNSTIRLEVLREGNPVLGDVELTVTLLPTAKPK